MLVLPVAPDTPVHACANAGVDDGHLPPVVVVELGRAGDDGGTQGHIAGRQRVAAEIAADQPLDGESLQRVGGDGGVLGRDLVLLRARRPGNRSDLIAAGDVVARAPELGTQTAADADKQEEGEENAAHRIIRWGSNR